MRLTVRYGVLSLFITPALLAFATLRSDVIGTEPLLLLIRAYGFGYVFSLLSFGIGLLIAGMLAGTIVATMLKLPRPMFALLAVVTPAVLLPASILLSFYAFATGVPIIHNATPYILAATIGGAIVGVLGNLTVRRPII